MRMVKKKKPAGIHRLLIRKEPDVEYGTSHTSDEKMGNQYHEDGAVADTSEQLEISSPRSAKASSPPHSSSEEESVWLSAGQSTLGCGGDDAFAERGDDTSSCSEVSAHTDDYCCCLVHANTVVG